MREKIRRLENQAGARKRETALPISILPGQETFKVHWGYWGGDRPTPTYTETVPMSRLDEIRKRLKEEGLAAWPSMISVGFVAPDGEEFGHDT